MMRKVRIRQILLAATATMTLTTAIPSLASASDTDALVALLANKGVISSSEAQAITSAPVGTQQDRLVAILRKKGVLADSDLKTLRVSSKPATIASTDASYTPMPTVPPAAGRSAAPNLTVRKAAPFEIAGIQIAPVGYIALTGVARSTNTGNVVSTSFGAIPFDNTIPGNIGETRLTAQNTRLGLRANGNVWGLGLTGYVEMDFNGNDAGNLFVNSNSHTPRLRLAYADVDAGWFEASFGQMYSWLTPNRHGLGPDPRDVFLTNNIDQSFQVGLPWARQAAAHVVWHATPQLSLGAGVENPQQFTNGEVTFPVAFNAQLAGQFDNGVVPGTPNQAPDVVAKAAFDTDLGPNATLHVDAAGMWRHFEATFVPPGTGQFPKASADGWVAEASANLELFKTVTLIGTGFWSDGGGRYLGALGPDVVALPAGTAAAPGVALAPVRSRGYVAGAEWRLLPATVLSGYYGQAVFDNNFAADFTNTTFPNAIGGPFVGFGFPGSANNNNKKLEEWTADISHTFWADPRYGAIEALAQYSHVRREPWFVAPGAPSSASVNMLFTEVRYLLPWN